MKIYTFSEKTGKIVKTFNKKEGWIHFPKNEPSYKKAPFAEVYVHDTPKEDHITTIRISLTEFERIIKFLKR